MGRWKNLSISSKLILSFLMIFLIISCASVLALKLAQERTLNISDLALPKIQIVVDMEGDSGNMIESIQSFLLYGNDESEKNLSMNLQRMKNNYSRYVQKSVNIDERNTLDAMMQYAGKIETNGKRIFALKKEEIHNLSITENTIKETIEEIGKSDYSSTNKKTFIGHLENLEDYISEYPQNPNENIRMAIDKEIEKTTAFIEATGNDKSFRARFDEIVNTKNSLFKAVDEINELWTTTQGISHRLDVQINNGLKEMILFSVQHDTKQIRILTFITIVILFGIFLLSFLVMILITRSITKPIQTLDAVVTNLGNGILDWDFSIDSKDELGQLGHTLKRVIKSLAQLENAAKKIGQGDFDSHLKIRSEQDSLGIAIRQMQSNLKNLTRSSEEQTWVKSELARLLGVTQSKNDVQLLAEALLKEIGETLTIGHGAFYLRNGTGDNTRLDLLATYAFSERHGNFNQFKLGEGVVGQAALEKKPIIFTEVPDDFYNIQTGLGEKKPDYVYVVPILHEADLVAVLEIAGFKKLGQSQQELFGEIVKYIGVTIRALQRKKETEILLKQSQELTAQLQMQQEELRATNEELENKARVLKKNEEEIRMQSEELKATNEELKEKSTLLEAQAENITKKNEELTKKANELEAANKYKSEFLANMSHELRTPLNSLLILSKGFKENQEGNLKEDQVEDAKIIYEAGHDLLNLINDILDLSKVDAGKLDIIIERFDIEELISLLQHQFNPVAKEKGVPFIIEISPNLPDMIETDYVRLSQIIRNLLSNAFKFTEHGSVTLSLNPKNERWIEFTVEDTGIGIPNNKQEDIFEAFQQVDGSTSRKYGGTGLGLTISRQLVHLLQGELSLKSTEGKGSAFTVKIPIKSNEENIHTREFLKEESAIDLSVVGQSELFEKPEAEVVITPVNEEMTVKKPEAISEIKTVLIIENEPDTQIMLNSSLKPIQGDITVCDSVATGISKLQENHFDCLITNYKVGDIFGETLIKQLSSANENIPILVYSEKDLSRDESHKIEMHTHSIIIKGENTQERLLEEVKASLQKKEKGIVPSSEKGNINLSGKRILLADDDMRNVYATSKQIKRYGVEIEVATDGNKAVEAFSLNPEFDLIIMDIMMPNLDGFEAIKKIRAMTKGKSTPIIALTAKAMPEDKKKCIDAGANEYISKPVDIELLIHSMQRLMGK